MSISMEINDMKVVLIHDTCYEWNLWFFLKITSIDIQFYYFFNNESTRVRHKTDWAGWNDFFYEKRKKDENEIDS